MTAAAMIDAIFIFNFRKSVVAGPASSAGPAFP